MVQGGNNIIVGILTPREDRDVCRPTTFLCLVRENPNAWELCPSVQFGPSFFHLQSVESK